VRGLAPVHLQALRDLRIAEVSCGGPGSGYAWATSGPTHVHVSGAGWQQVELHWRHVAVLLRRDLVDVESYDAQWDSVDLTDLGRDQADRLLSAAS
jgi:hypothetical protein